MLFACWRIPISQRRSCRLPNFKRPSRKRTVVLPLILTSVVFPLAAGLCTKVGVAAKLAYDGQIRYIRRGINGDTAQHIFAEFMRSLATEAWQVDEFATNFSDVCLNDPFLATKVNDEGSILSMVALEAEIASSHANIPLLAASRVENVPYDTSAVEDAWAQTSSYLSALIPPVLDAREMIFPDDATLRVDPSHADACYEFQDRFNIAGYATMPADEYIEGIVSMVMSAISCQANRTKAMQILKHATAHVNCGIRCLGVERADLQVPTIFLADYARQIVWLCGNASTPPLEMARKAAVRNLLLNYHALIDLLTSFQCGGRLSSEVVSAEGRLRHMNFEWNSLKDVQLTISDSVTLDSQLVQYLPTKPRVPRLAISMRMHESESPSETFQIQEQSDLPGSRSPRNGPIKAMNGIKQSTITIVHRVQAMIGLIKNRGSQKVPSTARLELSTTIRNSCDLPWTFIERPGVTLWHEQCCAPICVAASESLSGQLLADFQEACCSECHQLSCEGGGEAAVEEAENTLGITLPPYNEEETPEPIPIMI